MSRSRLPFYSKSVQFWYGSSSDTSRPGIAHEPSYFSDSGQYEVSGLLRAGLPTEVTNRGIRVQLFIGPLKSEGSDDSFGNDYDDNSESGSDEKSESDSDDNFIENSDYCWAALDCSPSNNLFLNPAILLRRVKTMSSELDNTPEYSRVAASSLLMLSPPQKRDGQQLVTYVRQTNEGLLHQAQHYQEHTLIGMEFRPTYIHPEDRWNPQSRTLMFDGVFNRSGYVVTQLRSVHFVIHIGMFSRSTWCRILPAYKGKAFKGGKVSDYTPSGREGQKSSRKFAIYGNISRTCEYFAAYTKLDNIEIYSMPISRLSVWYKPLLNYVEAPDDKLDKYSVDSNNMLIEG